MGLNRTYFLRSMLFLLHPSPPPPPLSNLHPFFHPRPHERRRHNPVYTSYGTLFAHPPGKRSSFSEKKHFRPQTNTQRLVCLPENPTPRCVRACVRLPPSLSFPLSLSLCYMCDAWYVTIILRKDEIARRKRLGLPLDGLIDKAMLQSAAAGKGGPATGKSGAPPRQPAMGGGGGGQSRYVFFLFIFFVDVSY